MTIDELIRAFCYFLLFPAYTYFALIAYNRRAWSSAASHGLLAAFFCMLMFGLVLRHYYVPVPTLLYGNTAIVVALTIVVTWRATAIFMAALQAMMIECISGKRGELRIDIE